MDAPQPGGGARPRTRPIDQWPAVVFLLTRQPRRARELCKLLGITEDTAARYLHRLEAEGLVTQRVPTREEMKGANGRRPAVWTWTPNPT